MTSFPEPEMRSSRWRPEAEGPPFSTTTTMVGEKLSPGLGWRHFRCRHLGIKMAAPQVTSEGRRNSREDVPSSERGRPSPKTSRRRLKLFFLLFEKHLIVSLPQPFLKWLRELPACHYGEVDQSAHVKPRSMGHGVDFGKHLFYFFWILCFYFFNCTLQ